MNSVKTRTVIVSLCVALCLTAAARAEVKPSNLFSDHMVLQSGMSVPVWGTADPAEKVTIKFNGQTRSATADASGKWMVHLTKLKSGGPFEMTIAGNKAGEAPIIVKDVLVGEVWLGSGQSNMDFTVATTTRHYFAGVPTRPQESCGRQLSQHPHVHWRMEDQLPSRSPASQVAGLSSRQRT